MSDRGFYILLITMSLLGIIGSVMSAIKSKNKGERFAWITCAMWATNHLLSILNRF